jgi:putative transposase
VAGYKSAVTRRIRAVLDDPKLRIWQRNYYEHVIRNNDDLDRIRRYIRTNPAQWALDRDNPAHPNTSHFNARRPPYGES